MSKNQGVILDIAISCGVALISCMLLSLINFHPVGVFVVLADARYGKWTLARSIKGLRQVGNDRLINQ